MTEGSHGRPPDDPDEVDDSRLLRRIAVDRDPEAWGELVSRHGGAVFALALTITRDHADAADAVQDAFIIVRRSAAGFHYGASARSWLFKIVSREALRIAKRRQRRANRSMEDAMDTHITDPSPAHCVEQQEILGALRHAVEDLPLVLRSTVALRFFAGMTQAQIADELGCERSTVSTRITQALGRLRQRLGPAQGAHLSVLLPALFDGSADLGLPEALHQSLGRIGTARSSQLLIASRGAAPTSSGALGKLAVAVLALVAAGFAGLFWLRGPEVVPGSTPAAGPAGVATPDPAPVAGLAPSPSGRRWFWSFEDGVPAEWRIADPDGILSWTAEAAGRQGVLACDGGGYAMAVLPVGLDRPFVVRYRWYPSAGWNEAITVDHPVGPDGLPPRRNWQLPVSRPGAPAWAEYEHYHRDGWMVSRLRIGDRTEAKVTRVSRYQLPVGRSDYRQAIILRDVLLSEMEIRELSDADYDAAVGDPMQLPGVARARSQNYAGGLGSSPPCSS